MRKTIGILAHVDAGKTTFSESVLYAAEAVPELVFDVLAVLDAADIGYPAVDVEPEREALDVVFGNVSVHSDVDKAVEIVVFRLFAALFADRLADFPRRAAPGRA